MRKRFGMVHGRFQPFHRGHLQYTLAALVQCEHLIIGVTNPDPSLLICEATDPERHKPLANVFTFFERQWMIRATLLEVGVDLARVSIVPFPIHSPERWRFYCPTDTTQFVRVFSAWGEEKVRRMQANGWAVKIIDVGIQKEISGSVVRAKLCHGEGWEDLVPEAVAQVLRAIKATERLRQIANSLE